MKGLIRALSLALLTLSVALGLVGCGSSGSGSDSPDDDPGSGSETTLSGVAAAGAPIRGRVFVTGAGSPTPLVATINADGTYSLDVASLTAPYLIKAEGTTSAQGVTLYSFVDDLEGSGGRANITPATHLAVAAALGGDPEAVSSQPGFSLPSDMETKVQEAIDLLEQKLATALADQGVSNVDLRSMAFSANGTGLDAIFDCLDFKVTAGSNLMVSLVDRATGTVLLQRNATTGANTVDLPPAQIAATVNAAVSDKEGVAQCFRAILAAAATGDTAALQDLIAPEAMDTGKDRAERITDWVSATGLHSGVTLQSVCIIRRMSTYTFPSTSLPDFNEHGSYTRGIWVAMRGDDTIRGEWSLVTGFVQDSTGEWLFYGDQVPFTDSSGISRADKDVTYNAATQDSEEAVSTGVLFYMEDLEGDGFSAIPVVMTWGPELGIAQLKENAWGTVCTADTFVSLAPGSVGFTTPGASSPTISTTGLTQARQSDVLATSPTYNPYVPYNLATGAFLKESLGLDLTKIADGSEYRFLAFDSSGQPVRAWIRVVQARPLSLTELAQLDRFPRLVSINGQQLTHFPSDWGLPGSLSLTWENLGGTYTNSIEVDGQDYDNPHKADPSQDKFAWTAFTGPVPSDALTLLRLRAYDDKGRRYGLNWHFETAP